MKLGNFSKILLLCGLFIATPGCFALYADYDDYNSYTQEYDESCSESSNTRELPDCDGIILNGVGDIQVKQGPKQSIHIEASDYLLNRIKTERINGKLVISFKNHTKIRSKVRFYITLPEINKLEIDGSGNIRVLTPLNSRNVTCSISGAGRIELRGKCDNLDCSIDGLGTIAAFKLKAKNCKATVDGAGTCEVFVTDYLDASIDGVGKVIFDGDPEVRHNVDGIGCIERR